MYYNYLIISSTMVSKIRFGQVKETGPEYLRYNGNNAKTFVKWDCGNTGIAKTSVIPTYTPDCIFQLMDNHTLGTDYWGPFSADDMRTELLKSEWTDNEV